MVRFFIKISIFTTIWKIKRINFDSPNSTQLIFASETIIFHHATASYPSKLETTVVKMKVTLPERLICSSSLNEQSPASRNDTLETALSFLIKKRALNQSAACVSVREVWKLWKYSKTEKTNEEYAALDCLLRDEIFISPYLDSPTHKVVLSHILSSCTEYTIERGSIVLICKIHLDDT